MFKKENERHWKSTLAEITEMIVYCNEDIIEHIKLFAVAPFSPPWYFLGLKQQCMHLYLAQTITIRLPFNQLQQHLLYI